VDPVVPFPGADDEVPDCAHDASAPPIAFPHTSTGAPTRPGSEPEDPAAQSAPPVPRSPTALPHAVTGTRIAAPDTLGESAGDESDGVLDPTVADPSTAPPEVDGVPSTDTALFVAVTGTLSIERPAGAEPPDPAVDGVAADPPATDAVVPDTVTGTDTTAGADEPADGADPADADDDGFADDAPSAETALPSTVTGTDTRLADGWDGVSAEEPAPDEPAEADAAPLPTATPVSFRVTGTETRAGWFPAVAPLVPLDDAPPPTPTAVSEMVIGTEIDAPFDCAPLPPAFDPVPKIPTVLSDTETGTDNTPFVPPICPDEPVSAADAMPTPSVNRPAEKTASCSPLLIQTFITVLLPLRRCRIGIGAIGGRRAPESRRARSRRPTGANPTRARRREVGGASPDIGENAPREC
jgi:hypothetical protein